MANELHEVYDPVANATNVLNVNANIKSPGTWAATGSCAPSSIESPDNKFGSSTVVTPNEGSILIPLPEIQLNKVFSDNFLRPNENPLNPANWSVFPTGSYTNLPLQVLDNLCTALIVNDFGTEYANVSLSNDQYAKVTLGPNFNLNTYTELDAFIRMDSAFSTGIDLFLFSNGDGTGALDYYDYGTGNSAVVFSSFVPSTGDTWSIAAIGPNVYCYYNDVLVFQTTTSAVSGVAGTFIGLTSLTTDCSCSYFECGNVVPGVPPVDKKVNGRFDQFTVINNPA